MEKKNKKKEKTSQKKWLLIIFVVTFLLSALFNMLSTQLVEHVNNLILSFILLIVVVSIGIMFDLIGTAVTAADEVPFHAMASDKKKGAKESLKLIKNADRVSNVCADVIGDICGVLSGAIAALIAGSIAKMLGQEDITVTTLLVTATVTALTVWGKGVFKQVAIRNSTSIIKTVGRIVSIFSK
jgi:CBS domain containing-hemolysin-like protein